MENKPLSEILQQIIIEDLFDISIINDKLNFVIKPVKQEYPEIVLQYIKNLENIYQTNPETELDIETTEFIILTNQISEDDNSESDIPRASQHIISLSEYIIYMGPEILTTTGWYIKI